MRTFRSGTAFIACLALSGVRAADRPPEVSSLNGVLPGQTVLAKSAGGTRYFLRLPKSYHPKRGARVIVFLHGSNMNGLSYLRTFEARRWAPDDILVCPNGEEGDDPYGANNFTFGSAPRVAEVTREVLGAYRATRVYVGGHSQGGFLTYSVILHYPELYHGALPMAGDCWMQNEPNLWEDKPAVLAKQRRIAIAVIHGRADHVVSFSQGQHAYDVFLVMGYPKLRLFAPERLGHQFGLSPVAEALEWLDAVAGDDAARSLKAAAHYVKERDWGSAVECARNVLELQRGPRGARQKAQNLLKLADKAAKSHVKAVARAMAEEKPASWLPRWWEFRRQFGATQAAAPLVKKYDELRAAQRGQGRQLFEAARGHFRAKERDKGREILDELLDKAPASYEAYYAVSWLREE